MLDCGKIPDMGWEAVHRDRDLIPEAFHRCHCLSVPPFKDEGKRGMGRQGECSTWLMSSVAEKMTKISSGKW
jgi:hypothetical protein